jgi:hypothetical protein
MNTHSITFVRAPRSTFPGVYPTLEDGESEFGEGTGKYIKRGHLRSFILLTKPRREGVSNESEPEEFSSTEAAPYREGEDLGQAQSVNPGRNDALKRLMELEDFAKSLGNPATRDVAVRSCRDAVTLLSFWPSDLMAPDADIDDDGIVSVEQFKDDGTLQALFEFAEPNRAAFAVLTGTKVVSKGYVSTLDAGDMSRAFERIRFAADNPV